MGCVERLIDAAPLIKHFSSGDRVRSVVERAYENKFVTALQNAPIVHTAVLPCKIGDIVWGIKKHNNGRLFVKQGIVSQMYYGDDMQLCVCVKRVCRGQWGKNVFATKEETCEEMGRAMHEDLSVL